MDTTVAEIRAITLREMELEKEKAQLHQRKLELLELNHGARKSSRDMLSPENRKALFAAQKRKSHERGKAR